MPVQSAAPSPNRTRIAGLISVLAVGILAGACSSSDSVGGLESMLGPQQQTASTGASDGSDGDRPKMAASDLDKAIAYWGEQHAKQPTDLKAALAYARNLKAAGHKDKAFGVLQSAALIHGDSKELANEMGRMALEFDQVGLADKLLAMADDPVKPDWRVVNARGTVMAKQGNYAEAIPFFERALAMAPGKASVMNNLAMANAASGNPGKAEELLRKASAGSADPKIRQNLALVLGLQGRHDEANTIRASGGAGALASADTDYIKRMVKDTPGSRPAAASPAIATQPARGLPSPRVIEATAPLTPAASGGLRPAAGPADVASSAWSTTVSAAR